MFCWTRREAEKKFPCCMILQSRFRGAKHISGGRVSKEEELLDEVKEGEPFTPLGVAMRELFRCTWSSDKDTDSCKGVIEESLEQIKKDRGITNIDEQYNACKELAAQRDKVKEYPYDDVVNFKQLDSYWAITQQLRFGLLVREIFHKHTHPNLPKLDPVFTSLLNPTGGVLGTPKMWIHELYLFQDGPLPYERVCKDTVWYLKTYHNINTSEYGKYSGTFTWYWVYSAIHKMPMWY